MKAIILIVSILLFAGNIVPAQEKQKEEQKKEKAEKETKKNPFRVMTKEEYEKMRAKEKPQPPPPDVENFSLRKKLIEDSIFEVNKNFAQSIVKNENISQVVSLKSLDLNAISCIRIANRTGHLVILNPIDVYTADLGYYSPNGDLIWKKSLDFSENKLDLSRQIVYCDITPNGDYIAVQGISGEITYLLFLFNKKGEKNSSLSGNYQLSPSGNYFYSQDQMTIFNLNMSPVELPFEKVTSSQLNQYNSRWSFQILDDDIVLLFVTNYLKIANSGNHPRQRPKISESKMIIYDLERESILGEQNLKIDEYEKYLLNKATFSNGWLGFILYNGKLRKSEVVVMNLNKSISRSMDGSQITNILLSKTTSHLFIHKLLRRDGYIGYYAFSILDLINDKYFIKNIGLNTQISSFKLNKTGTVILFSSNSESFLRTGIYYDSHGNLRGRFVGWVDRDLNNVIVPIKNQSQPSKTDLIKINLEGL